MRKAFFIWLMFCAVLAGAQTFEGLPKQPEPKKNFLDKVFVGGNIGLQFGTVTFIDVSPLVGYKITERFWAGIGGTYQYYKYRTGISSYTANVYGGRVFSRFYVFESVFLHGEYEVLNLPSYVFPSQRINVESILVGGGFRQSLGERAFLDIMILWNLNESVYSPYRNPIIRGGFNFSL